MVKKGSPSADDQEVWNVANEIELLSQRLEPLRQKKWKTSEDVAKLRELDQAARELEAKLASLKPQDTQYAEKVKERVENFRREVANEQQRLAQEFSKALQELQATTGTPPTPEQLGITTSKERMRDFLLEAALLAVQTIKAIGGKLSWIFFGK